MLGRVVDPLVPVIEVRVSSFLIRAMLLPFLSAYY